MQPTHYNQTDHFPVTPHHPWGDIKKVTGGDGELREGVTTATCNKSGRLSKNENMYHLKQMHSSSKTHLKVYVKRIGFAEIQNKQTENVICEPVVNTQRTAE